MCASEANERLTNMCFMWHTCQNTCSIYIHILSMHFPYITYCMALYNNNIPTKHKHWEEWEHLCKLSHFHIQKLVFLSIFCWYFLYFVGTNYMFVGLHVPTNFQMYRQPPPPPPLAIRCHGTSVHVRDSYHSVCILYKILWWWLQIAPTRDKKDYYYHFYCTNAVWNSAVLCFLVLGGKTPKCTDRKKKK